MITPFHMVCPQQFSDCGLYAADAEGWALFINAYTRISGGGTKGPASRDAASPILRRGISKSGLELGFDESFAFVAELEGEEVAALVEGAEE